MSAAVQLIEQGRQEGRQKKALRTARKMLIKDMQIDPLKNRP